MNAPMTNDQLLAIIEQMKAENAKLKAQPARRVTMKVSDKGGVSVYGLGRFPVTLYRSQWERLLDRTTADSVLAFIEANATLLAVKA